MYFYIIAKAQEHPRATALKEKLEAAGHRCTMDWMRYVSMHGKDNPATEVDLRRYGIMDTNGVKTAQVVFVFPHKDLDGGKMELGMCSVLDKPVFVMGERTEFRTDRVPFLHMDNLHFTSEDEVLAFFAA